MVGHFYLVAAVLLGGAFLICALRVWRSGAVCERPAKQMFAYSIVYLFALFLIMTVDAIARSRAFS